MAPANRKPAPADALDGPPVRLADRLSSTLFVALLAHGVVILGVTFTASLLPKTDVLPSLNVTLVVDSSEVDPPQQSELLADANQQGGGRAAEGERPTTPLAADQPLTQAGDPGAADAADARPREEAPPVEQVVTRGASGERVQALPKSTDVPAAVVQSAAALLNVSARQALANEIDVEARLPDSDDSDETPKPTTQESVLAAYLDEWRRRVERIGTVNFPERFRGDHGFGRPTLEVAIGAAGELEEIVVRRSSGNSALDQAAVGILRLAAPFDPLPDAIRAEYDVLRFAYEWQFLDGAEASAAAAAR
ncbi:MAG: TonB family protein [Gammaproteobacteria bacterium]|nr:TonB family protein [Gammaproteobacteria bacterium]